MSPILASGGDSPALSDWVSGPCQEVWWCCSLQVTSRCWTQWLYIQGSWLESMGHPWVLVLTSSTQCPGSLHNTQAARPSKVASQAHALTDSCLGNNAFGEWACRWCALSVWASFQCMALSSKFALSCLLYKKWLWAFKIFVPLSISIILSLSVEGTTKVLQEERFLIPSSRALTWYQQASAVPTASQGPGSCSRYSFSSTGSLRYMAARTM